MQQDKPPILGSWHNIYWVVLLNLLAMILFLFYLTYRY